MTRCKLCKKNAGMFQLNEKTWFCLDCAKILITEAWMIYTEQLEEIKAERKRQKNKEK